LDLARYSRIERACDRIDVACQTDDRVVILTEFDICCEKPTMRISSRGRRVCEANCPRLPTLAEQLVKASMYET
jgi:hypothetical protein